MTDNECRCGRPTRNVAYTCDVCADELFKALGDITWLDEELETSTTKVAGIDYRRVGGGSGGKKPNERPSPVAWGASDARGHLRAVMVAWVLYCHTEDVRNSSPYPGLPNDTLPAMSRWLMWRVDGLTLLDIGPDAVDEITDAVAKCHKAIDSRPDKWYAGPCNAEVESVECGADLYALADRGDVKCPVCASVYDVGARRAWLLEAAEDRLADASTLARSVSWLGAAPLNAARVRKWAERGRIVAKAHIDGRPLYRVGDAITLLAKDAAPDTRDRKAG